MDVLKGIKYFLNLICFKNRVGIKLRQNKYLNNIIEQDHRAIKRILKIMLGLKSFRSAAITLAGIEIMHMIKKGQMIYSASYPLTPAQQFYSLTA
jgi:putative transposase